MPIINIQGVHKTLGGKPIFDDLDLTLYRKEKVGLIGPNGCGKTTLFRMILGQMTPDDGQIIRRRDANIGYLPQEAVFDGEKTIIQEMHSGIEDILRMQKKIETHAHKLSECTGAALDEAMAEYDRLNHQFEATGGYEYEIKINTILAGVGIGMELYGIKTSSLSGGQKSRLGLAKVLMQDTDMLLLDEPTNHLDLQAVQWLEKFLKNYPGAAVIISHDRYLLDNIATKIIEMGQRQAKVWKGNYTTYLDSKDTIKLQEEREYEKRAKFLEKERDFIARNRNDVGMKKVARGRAKRLERMLKTNPDYLSRQEKKRSLSFNFKDVDKQSQIVLRCDLLGKQFDDLVLFKNLSFDLLAGERLGITGPNGTGKSTFLKLALGIERPTEGTIKFSKSMRVGYLDQQAATLDPEKTVLDEFRDGLDEYISPEQARNKLGAFLFTGDDIEKRVGSLSGGEQNRLMLCKIVFTEPQVLILDEPTNHLDIPSKEMLEEALQSFNGTLIVVSHDRYFIDNVVDRLLIVGADEYAKKQMATCELISGYSAGDLDCNIEDGVYTKYASMIDERLAMKQIKQDQKKQAANKASQQNTQQKQTRKAPDDIKQFNKYRVEQIEEMIMQAEDEMPLLREKFGHEDIYKDPAKLSELQQEFDKKEEYLNLLYKAYEYKM